MAALIPALEHHLLFEAIHGDRHIYQFPHDHVREAAYALLPESERARVHLEIGRRLLASTAPEALPEKVFEIVSQLDRGAALIEARHERERIAELHLLAGTRAQDSTAYASALYYFTAGAELLAADPGIARPELAFALELHRAQCELMTSAFGAAEQRLAGLAQRAAGLLDLAPVTVMRIGLYMAIDQIDRAVEASLDYLRRVGTEWSAHPTDDEVRHEYDRIWQQLGSRAIEDLVDLPPMTDPERRATMDVLTLAQTPALFIVSTQLQLARSLRGMTSELGSFDDGTFSEQALEQRLEHEPRLATCWYWLHKLQAQFLAGDHQGAVAAAARARPFLWTMPSFPEIPEYAFYAALACAAYHDRAPQDEQPALREELAAHHAQLAAWAEQCPDNFRDRAALTGGELARIRGEADRRSGSTSKRSAHRASTAFVQHEAIAYEVAARFHREHDRALVADAYVREAHVRYVRWGAEGKARQLHRAHPDLELQPAGPADVALRPEHPDRDHELALAARRDGAPV